MKQGKLLGYAALTQPTKLTALQKVAAAKGLSKDVQEVVGKTLGGGQ